MEIIFRGQHLHIEDRFREHATERLNKLNRYLPMADHAIVDVRREAKGDAGRYVVQVTVSANGTFMRAEERNFDLLTALDATGDALSQQVKRFKEKKVLRSERRVNKEELMPKSEPAREPLPPDTELVLGRVVRLKHFPMKPMTEAEAIEQMEMLSHAFFLFEDTDKGTLAVLYRRRDGDYGMILPETA
ncbi:MAG TPA: ribosome-associated translation inhibitor RaiA [Dehalococcoidia bacterium]|nr:ribosome-associated translation inhibitor RaiA [Dehalococcoidia bacterium]